MCPRTPSSEFAGFLKQMMGGGWALAHGRHIQGSAEQIPAFGRATSLTVKPHALTKKKTHEMWGEWVALSPPSLPILLCQAGMP